MLRIGVPDPSIMNPPGLVWVIIGVGIVLAVGWAIREWEDSHRD